MGEESNKELAFLDILLKRNNESISVLVHRKPMHIDQYLHTVPTIEKIARKVFFLLYLIEVISLSPIKMT